MVKPNEGGGAPAKAGGGGGNGGNKKKNKGKKVNANADEDEGEQCDDAPPPSSESPIQGNVLHGAQRPHNQHVQLHVPNVPYGPHAPRGPQGFLGPRPPYGPHGPSSVQVPANHNPPPRSKGRCHFHPIPKYGLPGSY